MNEDVGRSDAVCRHPGQSAFGEAPRSDSDECFRLLVQSVQDYAIFMLDPEGRVASWNAGAERIKGYRADEIVGRHFSVFYMPEDVAIGKPAENLKAALSRGCFSNEGWRMRRDGTRFWADVSITAIRDAAGVLHGFAKITRDMTERLRLAELEHARDLAEHVQHMREKEQKRIAQELHDDLGQQLTVLKMDLALLEEEWRDLMPAGGLRKIGAMHAQIDVGIASVRRIVADLRPLALDELGLPAALEVLMDEVRQRHRIDVTFRTTGMETDFNDRASIVVFRIVQEALTNVIRHAAATAVDIEIAEAGGILTIRIEDDGRGMAVDSLCLSKSFGLIGMRERARQLGGAVSIDSAPGKGFRVAVNLPLDVLVAPGRGA